MSHLLYSKRIYWDGQKGGVTSGNVYRNLTQRPLFREVAEIDYAPEVGCMQLRPNKDKMREMTRVEIRTAERYLAAVLAGLPTRDLPFEEND